MTGGTNLLSLAAALVGLTLLLGGSLVIVEGAFAGTDRDTGERTTALVASERLVDGPIAHRENVLDVGALDELDEGDLRDLGAGERYAVGVRIDGEPVASAGDPAGGTTVRRVVLVERTDPVERTVADPAGGIVLPSGVGGATVTVDPPPETTVETVRVDGRIVLHDETGLDGDFDIALARHGNATVTVEADGELSEGTVAIAYETPAHEPAVLAVTARERRGGDDA